LSKEISVNDSICAEGEWGGGDRDREMGRENGRGRGENGGRGRCRKRGRKKRGRESRLFKNLSRTNFGIF